MVKELLSPESHTTINRDCDLGTGAELSLRIARPYYYLNELLCTDDLIQKLQLFVEEFLDWLARVARQKSPSVLFEHTRIGFHALTPKPSYP